MGNFYKDQERAKLVIINYAGTTYADVPTLRREVRAAGFYWGAAKIADLCSDLVYQKKLIKVKLDGDDFYVGEGYHKMVQAAQKEKLATNVFDDQVKKLGLEVQR